MSHRILGKGRRDLMSEKPTITGLVRSAWRGFVILVLAFSLIYVVGVAMDFAEQLQETRREDEAKRARLAFTAALVRDGVFADALSTARRNLDLDDDADMRVNEWKVSDFKIGRRYAVRGQSLGSPPVHFVVKFYELPALISFGGSSGKVLSPPQFESGAEAPMLVAYRKLSGVPLSVTGREQ